MGTITMHTYPDNAVIWHEHRHFPTGHRTSGLAACTLIRINVYPYRQHICLLQVWDDERASHDSDPDHAKLAHWDNYTRPNDAIRMAITLMDDTLNTYQIQYISPPDDPDDPSGFGGFDTIFTNGHHAP
jgi:hypothetical protein